MPDINFIHNTLITFATAALLLALPGMGIARAILPDERRGAVLLAPLCGLCMFGAFALGACSLVGFSVTSISICWLTLMATWLVPGGTKTIFKHRRKFSDTLRTGALLVLALIVASTITAHIIPFNHNEATFVAAPTYDHFKAAVVDTIAREGLPALNPFYAPEGKAVEFNYYYAWHFVAACIKKIMGISGWETDAGLTFFTAFAVAAFLAGLARRISGSFFAGIIAIIFTASAPLFNLLAKIFGESSEIIFKHPASHLFPTLLPQLAWVPQHAASAGALLLAIFALCGEEKRETDARKYTRILRGGVIGLALAFSFGASAWAFAAFCVSLPLVAVTIIICNRKFFSKERVIFLSIATLTALVFAIPTLRACLAGTGSDASPISFGVKVATRLVSPYTPFGKGLHAALYWVQYLPLLLGMQLAGVIAMKKYMQSDSGKDSKHFALVSLAATLGGLLAIQFIRGNISGNDIGLRGILLPNMLLAIWAAVFIAKLKGKNTLPGKACFALCMAGILLALAAGIDWIRLPQTNTNDTLKIEAGKLFQKYERAWQMARKHTGESELVLSTPGDCKHMVPFPCNLPWAMFAERRSAFSSATNAQVYGFRLDAGTRKKTEETVSRLFNGTTTPGDIEYIFKNMKVKTLVLRKGEGWIRGRMLLEKFYSVADEDEDFYIYTTRQTPVAQDASDR